MELEEREFSIIKVIGLSPPFVIFSELKMPFFFKN